MQRERERDRERERERETERQRETERERQRERDGSRLCWFSGRENFAHSDYGTIYTLGGFTIRQTKKNSRIKNLKLIKTT